MLNVDLGCNVPITGLKNGSKASLMPEGGMIVTRIHRKLEQVKPDIGILEADKGLEDVATNVVPSFKLEAAELVAGAAAGLRRGGGRRHRCNLGERVLQLTHGLLASGSWQLADSWPGLVGIKELAKLAERADALLPVALVLGEAAFAIDEVDGLGLAEDAIVDMVIHSRAGGREVGAIAAGVAAGVDDVVPSGAGFVSRSSDFDEQLGHVLRVVVAAGGDSFAGIDAWGACGVGGEGGAKSGGARQRHIPTGARAI